MSRAVVRVAVTDATGVSYGTGVVVADNGVLTAWHVVDDPNPPTVLTSDGRAIPAQVAARDEGGELVLLRTDRPLGITPIHLSDVEASAGQGVELLGFGKSGSLRRWSAPVGAIHQVSESGRDDYVRTLDLTTTCLVGDSGGPVVAAGRLVGIIWGGPNQDAQGRTHTVYATCCRRIRRFLGGILRPVTRPVTRPYRQAESRKPKAETLPAPRALVPVPNQAADPRLITPTEPSRGAAIKRVEPPPSIEIPTPPEHTPGALAPVKPPVVPEASVATPASPDIETPDPLPPVADTQPAQRLTRQVPAASPGNTAHPLTTGAGAFSWGTALAGLLGVGGPAGLGIGAGAWLISRSIGRRQRVDSWLPSAPDTLKPPRCKPPRREPAKGEAPVIATDTPAPPQSIRTVTEFAPFETDRTAAAYAWARLQMARKYPGAVDALEAEQKLAEQYLAANPQ
ncbi:MAG: trypsin-like serine protease [bacterium]|nr:trypsin-like serine protease [bacterium]